MFSTSEVSSYALDFVLDSYKKLSDFDHSCYITILWMIWSNMNKARVGEKMLNPYEVFVRAREYISKYLEAQRKECQSAYVQLNWFPPPNDSYKINFDEPCFMNERSSGIVFNIP